MSRWPKACCLQGIVLEDLLCPSDLGGSGGQTAFAPGEGSASLNNAQGPTSSVQQAQAQNAGKANELFKSGIALVKS